MEGFPEEHFVLTQRLQGEDGKGMIWHIRAISQAENEKILQRCRVLRNSGRRGAEWYEVMLLAECVIKPELASAKLQNQYGVLGKEEVLLKLLTAGEYERLREAVARVNGM